MKTPPSETEIIFALQKALAQKDLVLFLGAGVSSDAGLPTWKNLVKKLALSLVTGRRARKMRRQEAAIRQWISNAEKAPPLVFGRLIKAGFPGKFNTIIHKALYEDGEEESHLIETICDFFEPNFSGHRIIAAVTYNFDDVLQRRLDNRKKGLYETIHFGHTAPQSRTSVPIYNVHGYLPENGRRVHREDVIFSEDAYHSLYEKPYHWGNRRQMEFLKNHTCLFVGHSLNDPNIRRLLDVATREAPPSKRHYAVIWPRPFVPRSPQSGTLREVIEEAYRRAFQEIGIAVHWVNRRSEIANFLKRVRETWYRPKTKTSRPAMFAPVSL